MSVLDKIYKKFTFAPVLKNRRGKMSVSQWYGENKVSFYKKRGLLGHNAIDLRCDIGTESYAPFSGTIHKVVHNPNEDTTRGEYIELDSKPFKIDGTEYKLRYRPYHLHKSLVLRGERVKKGQAIVLTGNTGKYTTGPHLHAAVYVYKNTSRGWVKAFPNNGYGGAIDPFPLFNSRHFTSRPKGVERYKPGQLVKSVYSPAVYYVGKDWKLYWIDNEEVFEWGRDHGLWGDWNEIRSMRGKLSGDYTFGINKI